MNGDTEKSTDITIEQTEEQFNDVTQEFPVATPKKTRTRTYQDVVAFRKRVEKRRKKKGYS